jgi:hypothetical protein
MQSPTFDEAPEADGSDRRQSGKPHGMTLLGRPALVAVVRFIHLAQTRHGVGNGIGSTVKVDPFSLYAK